jgi:hypothetical protein
MAILTYHKLQSTSEREYGGEVIARELIQWINARAGKQDCERIIQIIKASNALEAHRSRAAREARVVRRERRCGRQFAKLLAAGLGRYLFRPVYFGDSDGRWVILWTPLGVNRQSVPVIAYPTQAKVRWGEGSAIMALIELGRLGYVNRIRQCLCGKWFFARFAHQLNCSTRCQQKLFSQSIEYKRKRREYMRDYRRKENEKDARARRNAKMGQ